MLVDNSSNEETNKKKKEPEETNGGNLEEKCNKMAAVSDHGINRKITIFLHAERRVEKNHGAGKGLFLLLLLKTCIMPSSWTPETVAYLPD